MPSTLPSPTTNDLGSVLRVGVSTVIRRDTWQTNALLGLRLGYLKGQLDMFNRVTEKWGTAWLKPVDHWPAEEVAMAERLQRELRTVAWKRLRKKVEA